MEETLQEDVAATTRDTNLQTVAFEAAAISQALDAVLSIKR
jgi:hypothetical protein